MPSRTEVLDKTRVFDGFLKLDRITIRYEKFDGTMSKPFPYLVSDRGDSVAAVLYNRDKDTVILVKQFRAPTMKHDTGWITELVAGTVEPGENAEDTLLREIVEESGYDVQSVEHISTFYVSPGASTERIYLYGCEVTRQINEGGGLEEERENIEVVEISREFAIRGLNSGAFEDAKTIIGLMWLRDKFGA